MLLSKRFDDLFVGWEPVGVVLAVDQFVIDFDVEDSLAALDEFSVDAFGVFDCGRQTGGLW